jgi:hypothetical protein
MSMDWRKRNGLPCATSIVKQLVNPKTWIA